MRAPSDRDPGEPDVLEELVATPRVRVCRWRELIVQAWCEEATHHDLDLVNGAYDDMMARYPDGFCTIAVMALRELQGSPDAELRVRATKRFRKNDPFVKAGMIVIDTPGLAGMTLRVFMRALILAARVQSPFKVVDSFDEGFDWMLGVEGVDPRLVADGERVRELLRRWRAARPPGRAGR